MLKKLIDVDTTLEELKERDFEIDKIYHYGEITVCKTLETAQRLYNISNDEQRKKLDKIMFNKLKEVTNLSDRIVEKMLFSYKLDMNLNLPVDILINREEVIFKEFSLDDGFIESVDYIYSGKKIFINEEECTSLNSIIQENVRTLVKHE